MFAKRRLNGKRLQCHVWLGKIAAFPGLDVSTGRELARPKKEQATATDTRNKRHIEIWDRQAKDLKEAG